MDRSDTFARSRSAEVPEDRETLSESYLPAANRANFASCPLVTCETCRLIRNRSYNASSSSLSGSSFEAPTKQSRGTGNRLFPLSKRLRCKCQENPMESCYRSFKRVNRALRIAELALKISSMNATSAVGKYPSICRMYKSLSNPSTNCDSNFDKRVHLSSRADRTTPLERKIESTAFRNIFRHKACLIVCFAVPVDVSF